MCICIYIYIYIDTHTHAYGFSEPGSKFMIARLISRSAQVVAGPWRRGAPDRQPHSGGSGCCHLHPASGGPTSCLPGSCSQTSLCRHVCWRLWALCGAGALGALWLGVRVRSRGRGLARAPGLGGLHWRGGCRASSGLAHPGALWLEGLAPHSGPGLGPDLRAPSASLAPSLL